MKTIFRIIVILAALSMALTGCQLSDKASGTETTYETVSEPTAKSTELQPEKQSISYPSPTADESEQEVKKLNTGSEGADTETASGGTDETTTKPDTTTPVTEAVTEPVTSPATTETTTEAHVPKSDTSGTSSPSDYRAMEEEIFKYINKYRLDAGLQPLEIDYTYYCCAQTRANECARVWSHTRPDGTKFHTVFDDFGLSGSLRACGENLAKNFKTAESVMDALMESPAHRDNILCSDYTRVSICVIQSVENPDYFVLAQLFIKI